jgi:hypothetical protein
MIKIIIYVDNDIYMSMMSILIPDYVGTIDMSIILNYTENNEMIPERTAAAAEVLTAQELSSSYGEIHQGCHMGGLSLYRGLRAGFR